MGQIVNRTFEFTDLVVSTVYNLNADFAEQTLISFQLNPTGQSQVDSAYKIVYSNDGANWNDLPGATFSNVTVDTPQFVIDDTLSVRYLGFVMTSAGTETTGTLDLFIVAK